MTNMCGPPGREGNWGDWIPVEDFQEKGGDGFSQRHGSEKGRVGGEHGP